ncbi:MAG: hypothetical protein RBU37_16540 [Myxococcota bacterium]|nr:hypothetical protein [Myxococcota bacterium]
MHRLTLVLSLFLLVGCSKSKEESATGSAERPLEHIEVQAESISLQWRAPQKGDVLQVASENLIELDITVDTKQGSKKQSETKKGKKEYEIRILSVENETIKELEIEFGAYVENDNTRAAQGRTYVVSYADDKIAKIARSDGTSVPTFEADYVRSEVRSMGRSNPIERRLSGKTLQPGEPIELTEEDRQAFLEDEDAPEGELKMHYRGVTEKEGVKLGVIGIEGTMKKSKEGVDTSIKIEGDGLFEPTSGLMVETRMWGDIEVSGRSFGRIVKGSGTMSGSKQTFAPSE